MVVDERVNEGYRENEGEKKKEGRQEVRLVDKYRVLLLRTSSEIK